MQQVPSEHIYNIELVDPFTGEQAGKYGGVNEALRNGYKGENEGMFIIDASS